MTSLNLTDWVTPHLKTNPGLKFYKVPDRFPARFSTKNGKIPKRELPLPASPRITRSDVDEEIRCKAATLRDEFPDIARNISKPLSSWFELYDYFDAVDLWREGPAFLFYVLNHISNENRVLDHDLEESKHAEIRHWAKLWTEANVKRVLSIPTTQDIISVFDASEQESIHGLEARQLQTLRAELNICRMEYEHLLAPIEESRMQAPPQASQPMRQQEPHPYHPVQHHQGPPMIQSGLPVIPHVPPTAGRPFPMIVDEPRRNQMIPMQPMQAMQPMQPPPSTAHIPFRSFMENGGRLPLNAPPSVLAGDFCQDVSTQWERRQRGYSNETARNGRGRGNSHFNNFSHQNRSNFHANDRRMVGNDTTPRRSPLRRVSNANQASQVPVPIYVHDSQRQPPPFDNDATPRASGRGNNQRIFSEPSSGRTAFSNDARLWHASDRQRANSKPEEVANVPDIPPPFEGHQQADIKHRGFNSTCTFWYEGENRHSYFDAQAGRTIYAEGFKRDDFESHRLKDLFARCGVVESISYLFARNPDRGPAFIAFMDKPSVELAIEQLHNRELPSGVRLKVSYPRDRSRSDSYSSHFACEPNRHSNFTGSEDLQSRGHNRRSSQRNQSMTWRSPNYTGGMDDLNQPSSYSSDALIHSRAPLSEGFQAQLQSAQPFPMNDFTGPLNSSLAEVMQHQAAINRLPNQNQMPLNNIENLPNTYNKENNRGHSRNFSSGFDNGGEQSRQVMSQGSRNRKENSPKKKDSNKSTPFVSPKKDSHRTQWPENTQKTSGGDNNQKSYGGKNKKKGNKQNSSTRPSRAPSPEKSSFEDKLFAAMEAEQKQEAPIANTPKADAMTPSIVEAKKSGIEASAPIISDADENADIAATQAKRSECVEPAAISAIKEQPPIDSQKSNTQDPIHIPEVSVVIEQPAIQSSKPQIPESEIQSLAKSNDALPVAKARTPIATSKSEASERTTEVEVESKPRNKKKKNKKQRKSTGKSDADQSTISLNSMSSSETLKSSFLTESTEHFVTAQSSPNQGLTSGSSETCLCPADTTIKPITIPERPVSSPIENEQFSFVQHSKTDSNASAGSTPKSMPKSIVKPGKKQRQNQTHSKTDSNTSTISGGSVRNSDLKSKSAQNTDDNVAPSAGGKNKYDSQKENDLSLPAVNLEDPTQWPSLGPAKSPLIVDDKPPAVTVLQHLSERKKNPNAPIIPAVPLNLQRRRPSVDSSAWPIVKKCDMK